MATGKKTAKSRTTRTEVMSIRLDPQLRYLAEIAARVQRRTLSSYVEWAIIESLNLNILSNNPERDSRTVSDSAEDLWDVDEADRFIKLAITAPHLLNYDEQRLWKLIAECGYFWKGVWKDDGNGLTQTFDWETTSKTIIYDRLRESWELLNEINDGIFGMEFLPEWSATRDDPDHVNRMLGV